MGGMGRRLITVQDTYKIGDAYLLFLPGIPIAGAPDEVHVEDVIELRFPDGRIEREKLAMAGIPLGSGAKKEFVMGLPGTYSKHDIPIGTEVWTIDDPS